MSNTFEFDTLVVLIRSVNLRTEKHGEDDHLAVDIGLWLEPGEGGDQWEAVLSNVLDMDPQASTEFMQQVAEKGSTKFMIGKNFELHTAKFWASTKLLATLSAAKVNKFVMEWANDTHDDRVLFRIQAEADGKSVGKLADLIGLKVRLEVVGPPQAEMDVDGDPDE